MYTLLARREFRVFIMGQTLSTLGDNAVFVALGVWVKQLTGSSSAAGLVMLSYMVPMLLLPLGGFVADRHRRRPVLVVTNLALVPASVPLLLVDGPSGTWVIYGVAALYGLASAVLGPAQSAVLRSILSEEAEFGAAAGVSQSVRAGTTLLAPLLGASLLAWAGGRVFALVNITLLLVAASCFLLLRVDESSPRPRPHGWRADITAGFRHLRASDDIRHLVVAMTAMTSVIGFLQPMLFSLIEDGLHRAPQFLGLLETVLAVGSLAGSLAGGFLIGHLGPRRTVLTGSALFGIGVGLLLLPTVPSVLIGLVVAGAGSPAAVIGLATAAQAATPGHLMGRTQAAVNLCLTAPQALSIGVGSALVAALSFRQVTGVMIIGAAVSVALLCRPGSQAARLGTSPSPQHTTDSKAN